MVTLRIELPIANADGQPVTFDDAVGLWTAILRLSAECGLMTAAGDARCVFDGLENSPENANEPPHRSP